MPEAAYSSKHTAWVKTCSCCKKDFVAAGVKGWNNAFECFKEYFTQHDMMRDGLQSLCRICQNTNRKRNRGIADHDAKTMFEQQHGKCAICAIELFLPYRESGDPQGARVDHCHKSGKARGLLCHTCNILVGMYEVIRDRCPEFDHFTIENYINKEEM